MTTHDRHDRHGGHDGFVVSIETVVRARIRFAEVTEAQLRARDGEAGADVARSAASARPGWGARAPQRVPRWHAELDRGWDAHREAALRAGDLTAHGLAEVARSYLDADAVLAEHPGPAPRGHRASVPSPGPGPVVPTRLPVLDELTGLDHAVGVWRLRRDSARDTVEIIEAALEQLQWRGAAADSFHQWGRGLLDRWRALADAADTIGSRLADPRRDHADDPDDAAPNVPALTQRPPAIPTPPPPDAESITPTSDQASPFTSPSAAPSPPGPLPESPSPAVPDTTTATGPGDRYLGDISAVLDGPSSLHTSAHGTTGEAPAPDHDPDGHVDDASDVGTAESEPPTRPGRDGEAEPLSIPQPRTESDTPLEHGVPEQRSDSPAAPMSMAPKNVIAPDPDTLDGAPAPAPQTASTAAPPAVPPMASSAAVAGAAALARADRAHYIVREVTIPTPRPDTPAQAPAVDRQEAISSPRPHRAPAPEPGWPTPPTPRPDPGAPPSTAPSTASSAPPSTAGSGPADAPPHATHPAHRPVLSPRPGPSGPRRTLDARDPAPAGASAGDRRPMWVNLDPASGHGAWIDIAARPGLGLHGPGAAAITRTALRELHQHTATELLIPRPVLAALLTDPDQPQPANLADLADLADRIHLADNAHQALQTLHARLAEPPAPGPDGPPLLLVVPAPTTSHSNAALVATLDSPRAHCAGVLILGPWAHGATLDIDHGHQVHAHHHPASTDLTATRLHPTRPDELAHILRTDLVRDTDPAESITNGITTVLNDEDQRASDQPDTEEVAEQKSGTTPCRTPLALSVLGPVELRYRRPATDTDQDDGDSAGERWITITGLPQPCRDLLAFLAAHPRGVTRDAIIEALWPHSTSTKPENSFYQAKSRLTAIVDDATSDGSLRELVANPDGRWLLDSRLVTVDYWTLLESSDPDIPDTERRTAYRAAAHAYGGLFAADLTGRWAHDYRESARRHFLRITADLAETEVRDNPRITLAFLEQARNLEPLNEGIYRNIMAIQINNGQIDEARHTFELLRSQLAHIDAEPEGRTAQLLFTYSRGS